MTTSTTNGPCLHASDANFRTWGSNLNAALAAVGLTQTADTGQANWTTITRPAINTYAGYEIWRFNDTLQATAPVFIKIQYGTGSSAGNPRFAISVGTGSDGAGNLTGLVSTARPVVQNSAPSAGTFNTYACYKDGSLSLLWMYQGTATPANSYYGGFTISRTSDYSGNWTADGLLVVLGFGTSSLSTAPILGAQHFNFLDSSIHESTASTSNGTRTFGLMPTGAGAEPGMSDKFYLQYAWVRGLTPVVGLGGIFIDTIGTNATFTATPLGGSLRTYLATNQALGSISPTPTWGAGMAVLWE